MLASRKAFLSGSTSLLLLALAGAATAGGEFVREGVRKPYTVRNTLYSNSITEAEVAELRRIGSVSLDPYPLLDDQHYPTGWPEGIAFQAIGTQLILTPGSSVLPGLPVLDADGNAKLEFGDGLLPSNLIKPIGITATDAVQKPLPVDASFTLLITHASGKFSGSFTHPLGSTPYQGIILQKGNNKRGLGFFKTKSPAVKDYLGQAGSVLLVPQ